ncbi:MULTISPECIES: hypothetical protein [Pseudomonas aeruginosa group]|uniref:Uncharacterized protein n=1 Tax=Pseudomonas nitroreducens TaxID=46680 RepID=A0A6G6ISN6_PSENT|nr:MULTISPECIES: hypothetical protein [Pseudomonas aeruginosa group]QIE86145.1 hypothetical protein G5B91_07660 [Pseudomonas nitroreducens]
MKAIYLLIALVLAFTFFSRQIAEFTGGLVVVLLFVLLLVTLFKPLLSASAGKAKKED